MILLKAKNREMAFYNGVTDRLEGGRMSDLLVSPLFFFLNYHWENIFLQWHYHRGHSR